LGVLLLLVLIFHTPSSRSAVLIRPILSVILCVPILFLAVETFNTAFAGLTLDASWALTALLALFYTLLRPLLDLCFPPGKKIAVLVCATGFIAAAAAGIATSTFTAERPRPEALAYGWDANTHRAFWFRCDGPASKWSDSFFQKESSVGPIPNVYPMFNDCLFRSQPFRRSPAPYLEIPPPTLTIGSDRISPSGERELDLILSSPKGVRKRALFIKRPEGHYSIIFEGKPVVDPSLQNLKAAYQMILPKFDYQHWIVIQYTGPPGKDLWLRMTTEPEQPVLIKTLYQTDTLPDMTAYGYRSRPRESMPSQHPLVGNGILAFKEYNF
jgi:hypothetical protein